MLESCIDNKVPLVKKCVYCAIVYVITVDKYIDCQFICPECGCTLAQVIDSSDVLPHYTKKNITFSELYKAMNGFGLPEESQITEKEIRDIILRGQIEDIVTNTTVNNRIILERLVIKYNSDRFELFLESSGFGATIYKVKRSKS